MGIYSQFSLASSLRKALLIITHVMFKTLCPDDIASSPSYYFTTGYFIAARRAKKDADITVDI